MKKLNLEILSFILTALAIALVVTLYSWDGMVYFIEKGNGRTPAKFSEISSFKDIKSKKAFISLTEVISEDTIVINTKEKTNFKLKAIFNNNNKNICNEFSKIKVKFVALNTSVSGDTPNIVIETNCKVDNRNYMEGIKFPKKMLQEISLSEKVLFHYDQKISLNNIYDQLPEQFQMSEVIFYNPREGASSGSLKIDLPANNDLKIRL